MPEFDRSLIWFRRDLRLTDQAALFHALKSSKAVHCTFVFDTEILAGLPKAIAGSSLFGNPLLRSSRTWKGWGCAKDWPSRLNRWIRYHATMDSK
jgi:hypothetical protein